VTVDCRCAICDADDIQGRQLVMRGQRAGATYCHACGGRLRTARHAAVWIFAACTVLLIAALLLMKVLR
jgi:hypothetical protein